MKLRIKSNSLRYRLTRTDVEQLLKEGYLKEKVDFGDDELVYVLQSTSEDKLAADFKNNIVTMYMPKIMIDELDHTDKVGFESNNGLLHLLVEKDFMCLDNVAEDQSNNYPNPLAEKNHE
ncbi:MAG: hypothetical protein JWQ06_1762 [Mucilaginibacter sp.]|nr:hypothetical protein [Mucilaginibacter sp.]